MASLAAAATSGADLTAWLPPITLGGVGIWVLVFGLAGVIVKIWPAIKKLQNESDASLRADLMRRVTELENRLREEQKNCEQEVAALRNQLEGVTRQFIQFQIAVGQAVPLTSRTPEMESALKNLSRVISGREPKGDE